MSLSPAASSEVYLRLAGVRKAFGRVAALRGVDLEVCRGELMVLVGPSGCGKTTILRIIAGLELPDSGEVTVEGRSLRQLDTRDRSVAMVFQDFALYPHLTVFDNVAFGLRARKLPQSEVTARVAELATALDLAAKLERLPHELSGGEQQRVAIARALARRPSLLLLDEPLANLDPGLRVQFRADLSRLRTRFPVTIVHVTHDQAEAMAVGDRVAVMNGGKVLQCAAPAEVYRRPVNRFVASFFGSPAMNFLSGRLTKQGGVMRFEEDGSGPQRLRLELAPSPDATRESGPENVLLGIRPEHVGISEAPGSAFSAKARVAAVQFAGHEYHVVLSRDEAPSLTSRLATTGKAVPAVGDQVHLVLDTAQVLLFDSRGDILPV